MLKNSCEGSPEWILAHSSLPLAAVREGEEVPETVLA